MSRETLTLALPKSGLGATAAGDLYLGDIGIPNDTYRRAGMEVPAGLFGDAFTIRLHHTGSPDLPAPWPS